MTAALSSGYVSNEKHQIRHIAGLGPRRGPPGGPPGGLSKAYFARYGVLAFFFRLLRAGKKGLKTRGRAFGFNSFSILAIFGFWPFFALFR